MVRKHHDAHVVGQRLEDRAYLAVDGTENTLPKHSLVFRPTSASVTVLPAVPVAGLTAEDAPRLAERVRGEIARAIGAPVSPAA